MIKYNWRYNMYCVNCGNKLEKNFKFCPKCGEKVIELTEEKKSVKEVKETTKNIDNEYEEIKKFIIEYGSASASLLQRKYKFSYKKAS